MPVQGRFEVRDKVSVRAQQKISKLTRSSVLASVAQPPSRSAEGFPALEAEMPQGGRIGKQAHANTQIKRVDTGKEIHTAQEQKLTSQKSKLPCDKLG